MYSKKGSRNFLAELKRVKCLWRENKTWNENTKWQPVWNDLLIGRKEK